MSSRFTSSPLWVSGDDKHCRIRMSYKPRRKYRNETSEVVCQFLWGEVQLSFPPKPGGSQPGLNPFVSRCSARGLWFSERLIEVLVRATSENSLWNQDMSSRLSVCANPSSERSSVFIAGRCALRQKHRPRESNKEEKRKSSIFFSSSLKRTQQSIYKKRISWTLRACRGLLPTCRLMDNDINL